MVITDNYSIFYTELWKLGGETTIGTSEYQAA